MQQKRHSRKTIRAVSFALAGLLVLGVFALSQRTLAKGYEEEAVSARLRCILQLNAYTATVSPALQKAAAVHSAALFSDLVTQAYAAASCAKLCLDALPDDAGSLSALHRFYAQTADYALYLNKRLTAGDAVTQQERDTLTQLAQVAQQLSDSVGEVASLVLLRELPLGEVSRRMDAAGAPAQLEQVLQTVQQAVQAFPVLLYDGPFADAITPNNLDFLQAQPELTREEAAKKAAQVLEVDPILLRERENGTAPYETYRFYYGDRFVSISKRGGFLSELLCAAHTGTITISAETAIGHAQSFLQAEEYPHMQSTYWEIHDGVCTINFAFVQNGVRYYTELIKVGVCLETGRMVTVDAKGYLQNHRDRTAPQATITQQTAVDCVGSGLSADYRGLAVIPHNRGELLCHELYCTKGDAAYLLYIDAQTGEQASILQLIETAQGTLTR